jgi:queuine/archaeosine tRNA-ribosyltransferase
MQVERLYQINLGENHLSLPIFFPSISSLKTTLQQLQEYLEILKTLVGINNQFLVSAFDLARMDNKDSIIKLLTASRQAGAIILMDSGNYESFWKMEQQNWTKNDFHNMLTAYPCNIAFGFDEQNPPSDRNEHIALVTNRWQSDQEAGENCCIIPIIHAVASELPSLCADIAIKTGCTMLAVAERNLGDGISARAQTVQSIRKTLNEIGRYVALHLLGTGNPISIAIYTTMGADSFDGLEWCQTIVDYDTALLYHLSHADFFVKQTEWGDNALSFQTWTLAHNLSFFAKWMQRLRNAVKQGKIYDFCKYNFPEHVFRVYSNIFSTTDNL